MFIKKSSSELINVFNHGRINQLQKNFVNFNQQKKTKKMQINFLLVWQVFIKIFPKLQLKLRDKVFLFSTIGAFNILILSCPDLGSF